MSIHNEVIPKTNLLRFGKSLTSLLVFVLSRALAMSPAARVEFDIKVLGGVVSRTFFADIELVSERGVSGSACMRTTNVSTLATATRRMNVFAIMNRLMGPVVS
jgi:hypothetical protein